MTTATVAAAYGLNQQAPSVYRSEATVLVEARLTNTTTTAARTVTTPIANPVEPDVATEREVALSDLVLLPAAGRVGSGIDDFARDLTVEVVPGASVLKVVYESDNRLSAQIRAKALVEAYVGYRAQGPADVTVLSEPTLAEEPDTRPLLPDLAAGLGAGLLLGLGTAFLRSRTRGLIRSRDDFGTLAGTPVIATIPRYKRPSGTSTGAPVVLREPESPAAESYRYLRSRLQTALRPTSTTTILVTSPGDHQGRTTTAANLAVTLAQAGRTVVLVDADLRNPQLHHVFQVTGDYGLTTLLDGDTGVSEVIEETRVPRLSLIPAGQRDGDHVDLMDSAQIARVLRAVQKHADVVVIDTSAVLSAADAIALAALSDLVLLVGDYRRTRRETVRRALDELAEVVHGNVSPVLVNVPKSAGGLVPRARVHSVTSEEGPLTRDRLVSDADDVAPPGVTSHAYVEVVAEDDEAATDLADYYARTATVAVPVIYGSTQTATVYASTNAAATSGSGAQAISGPTVEAHIVPGPTVEAPIDHEAPDASSSAEPDSSTPAAPDSSSSSSGSSSSSSGSSSSSSGSSSSSSGSASPSSGSASSDAGDTAETSDEDLEDLAAASSPADIAGLHPETTADPESTSVVAVPDSSPAGSSADPASSPASPDADEVESGKDTVRARG
ncbi:polysaccharide biosynthesis tyrosine autokinase [Actinoplanes couchii]|uniref:polysaccharide biosynthesis tyrosine autokinase n=1 Tax=Actinoplanes couchii TaxID=403638 RepID=UPI001943FDD4|nr:CpsD/CapB family tyrosine-protein kinase [Actinoplanes couchii]MDR6321501.1 capsular exopolysaccharide synthesis family protein [Actinoplanes couchii]